VLPLTAEARQANAAGPPEPGRYRDRMSTIDIHAHGAVGSYLGAVREFDPSAPTLARRDTHYVFEYRDGSEFGPMPFGLVDPEPRWTDMARMGVDHQVIALRPKVFSPSTDAAIAGQVASLQNEAVIDFCRSSDGRASLMAALPMQAPDAAVAEVARLASHREVRGVNLEATIGTSNLDDPAFEPVWAALEQAGLPILVHPFQEDDTRLPRLTRYSLHNLIGNLVDSTIAIASIIFGGIVERYAELRWCFVHAGGGSTAYVHRWDHAWRNMGHLQETIDRPPSEYYRRLWFDTISHSPGGLHFLADLVGWDRIMIGTDYPWNMGDTDPVGTVNGLGLAKATEQKLLGDTAEGFLRPL